MNEREPPQEPERLEGVLLYVDGHAPGRSARSRLLTDAGLTVIEAGSGREALTIIARDAPDIVLLDDQLPDMTGQEVTTRLRSGTGRWMPIIQVSAVVPSIESQAAAIRSGADVYLVEPIEPVVLVAQVGAALRWKKAEDALYATNRDIVALYERVSAASRAKDDFLSVLSHELRTPLSNMLGWIRILRAGGLNDAQTAQALGVIERNAVTQERLVADLLDISRIAAGSFPLQREAVDLGAIVRSSAESMRPSVEARGLRLTVDVTEPVLCVDGDRQRLEEVVTNLLSNALKFTERGHIDVRMRRVDKAVELRVSDTGIGIEQDFLPHVFDRFSQADASRTRERGGLGLGLAITRYLVEAHGGKMSAESNGRNQGASFAVLLPCRDVQATNGRLVSTSAGRSTIATLGGVRVLLVEDHDDAREMMALLLRSWGAEVTCADRAEEAYALVGAREFDVLVTDVGLPGIDGFSMLHELRQRGTTMPAVALTGYTSADDRKRAREVGFAAHLSKPSDPDTLLLTLQRLVATRGT